MSFRSLQNKVLAVTFVLLSATVSAQTEVISTTSPAKAANALVIERVVEKDFSVTLDMLREQLKVDGWNLIAEINLGKRLAKKGVAVPGGLVIFKITSGKNAVPLLAEDETRYISAMMPCGVSVYGKNDGTVVISRMNFEMMGDMMQPKVAATMEKSVGKLNKSIDAVIAKLEIN